MALSFTETLARTARTLRERFEALRPIGPIPATMAESPPGVSYPYRGASNERLPVFESHDFPMPWWSSGAMVVRDGSHVAGRDIWLAGDRRAASRLMPVCHDANGFVPLLRREFGLPSDCGVGNPKQRWLWTVFELAECGVPGSLLSLVRPIFRCSPDGVIHASEEDIRWSHEHPEYSGFGANLLRGDFVAARHWQLADLIEASVMAMDLVDLVIGAGAIGGNAAPKVAGTDAIRETVVDAVKAALVDAKKPKPRGDSTCERLRDLHLNIDPKFAEEAPETLLGERIGRSPGTFPDSYYWTTVLQPKRREVRAQIREGRNRVGKAQKWGDFDSVGRPDEGIDPH